jgi:hypothetical protein
VYVGEVITPNDMNDGEAAFPEFHSVYMDPESFAGLTRWRFDLGKGGKHWMRAESEKLNRPALNKLAGAVTRIAFSNEEKRDESKRGRTSSQSSSDPDGQCPSSQIGIE